MNIKLYGGLNEIGGNKILLEHKDTKVWFDFGLSFGRMGMFYDEFMQPRKLNGLGDFFEVGLLPDIKGLYRNDFLNKCGRSDEKTAFDAVFLSHAHIDHSGFIPLLNKDIPVYCSAVSKQILKAMEDTGSGFKTEFELMKQHFTGLHYTKVPRFVRNVHGFDNHSVIKIKDLEIEPVFVDHSIPGATGFIVNKKLAYTGDLRFHGSNPSLTKDFVAKAKKAKPDILICEGTRVGGDHRKMGMSEKECFEKVSEYIKETKGLVVANFPPRDLDRINTFYQAALEGGRKLVIDTKMAYLLKTLEWPHLKDVLIYAKRKGDGNYSEKEYFDWEREFLPKALNYKDLDQKKSVLYLNAWSFGELIDLKPVKGTYIYSLCEPFNDEMELDFNRMQNWIKHFKLNFKQAHASGHASEKEIKSMIKQIHPKKIVWVHTTRKRKERS